MQESRELWERMQKRREAKADPVIDAALREYESRKQYPLWHRMQDRFKNDQEVANENQTKTS